MPFFKENLAHLKFACMIANARGAGGLNQHHAESKFFQLLNEQFKVNQWSNVRLIIVLLIIVSFTS